MIAIEKEGNIHWVFGRHSEVVGRFEMGMKEMLFVPMNLYKMSAEDLREIADYLDTI